MSQAITLRNLGADATDSVMALWTAVGLPVRPAGRDSPAALTRQLASGQVRLFGLFDGEQLIGAVLATHDTRRGTVNRLAVDPAHRRQGLAQRLIAACEAWFHDQGIEVWVAFIEAENMASLALFEREGYRLHENIVYASKRTRREA